MKNLLTIIIFISVVFSTKVDASKPNIILILADDMGPGEPSHAGGLIPTPALDRMAKEGMMFTDAHTTSSVCTPTRYGILTGRYNWRSRLKSGVLFNPTDKALMDPERLNMANFLQGSGYHTACIGKWHLGADWEKLPKNANADKSKRGASWQVDYSKPFRNGPVDVGFDEAFFILSSLDMAPYVYLKNDRAMVIPTVNKGFPHNEYNKYQRIGAAAADFEASDCLADWASESRDYIKSRAMDKKKPFFLYLPLSSPHTPIVPSKPWQGKSDLGKYGDFLMETDWVVGQVLQALDRHRLTENTIVIFATDNGCSPAAKIPALVAKGHKPNADWRGHKADIFEGGHRVPFLVRWPSRVKAGTSNPQTICTADLFATVADVIGKSTAIPSNAAEDSFSFLPALLGQAAAKRRPFTIHHSINGSFAIRRGKWKLTLCPGSGGWSAPKPAAAKKNKSLPPVQLYDLNSDPTEQNNLQAKHPKLVQDLVATLARAIKNGRTTPGPIQPNEGHPNTFSQSVLAVFPSLGR